MVNVEQPDFLTGLAAKNSIAADAAKYRDLIAAQRKASDIQYGAQLGAQEVVNRLPELYAQNDVKDSAFNRYNYGADYRQQAPVQIPAGATTNGARVQFDTPASSSPVDKYLADKEAWRQAQSKGK